MKKEDKVDPINDTSQAEESSELVRKLENRLENLQKMLNQFRSDRDAAISDASALKVTMNIMEIELEEYRQEKQKELDKKYENISEAGGW